METKQARKNHWFSDMINQDWMPTAYYIACSRMEEFTSYLRYIDKILYKWGKDGIKTVKDVEERRKKHNKEKDDSNIDMDLVDWNWFDEE